MEFEQSWNEHETKLVESANADVLALDELHANQLSEAREQIEAGLSTVYKASTKLLDNRTVFDKLIKQKKYSDAHELRAETEKMEKQEQAKHMQVREIKITKAMEKVIK